MNRPSVCFCGVIGECQIKGPHAQRTTSVVTVVRGSEGGGGGGDDRRPGSRTRAETSASTCATAAALSFNEACFEG